MPDARVKVVTESVKSGIEDIGLELTSGVPATVVARDVPIVLPKEIDDLPLIIASCSDLNCRSIYQSAQRATRLFPVQVTVIGASNRSTVSGRGLVQEWKEAIWEAFLKQQPRILDDYLADLYSQTVQEAEALSSQAWKGQYNVQILFVMVELEIEL